jgi:hypothetical protein
LLERASGVNFLVTNPSTVSVARPGVERILQILAIAVVVALVVFAVRVWPQLPAIVPTHFDFSGEPDGWGSRARLLGLPIIATLVFLVLTLVERAPHVYNYPIGITDENAAQVHALGRQLVLALKLILVLAFALMFRAAVDVALGKASALPHWFLPAVVGSMAGVILITFVRMNRTRVDAHA